jgi:uncharacterized BrkB/YihY/UPF0761 family membrane protein
MADPAGNRQSVVKSAGAFTGVAAGLIATQSLALSLFAGTGVMDVLACLLTLLMQGAVALLAVSHLPRPKQIKVVELLPGVALFVAGLGVLRLATGLYYAPHVGRITDLYGSLGLAAVLITWLYVLGRLAVARLTLNAVLARRRRERRSSPPPGRTTTSAPDLGRYRFRLAPGGGIEPPSEAPKAPVLPLDDPGPN